ncbi:sugar transferase [Labrys monachus]|uniref:Exopolysaccharide production protein ExoY n=1 Tax=Labrys monachus TaxID=217067 RepID=A0ABU0FA03_9HYPH|nr:sugar transferase [Labrys monachus]MDQ0391450.1 exopolysaccharide production protein ExoY [Labrys monachus]
MATNISKAVRPFETDVRAPVGGVSKRCFDILFALFVLALSAPVILVLAALVKLSDGGPVCFRHKRIGYSGEAFSCLKFRTMAVDADRILREHLEKNPEAMREWIETRKLKKDPRITPLGRVLRMSSLDELPQLLNILRGEMSIVGPRPVVSDEMGHYGADAAAYLRARPGLTGAWQVSGRSDVSYPFRVALDRNYVEQWSMLNDLVIIAKTIPAVFLAKGSY